MLSFKDLFHLPELSPWIADLVQDQDGLTLVTGLDPRLSESAGGFLPSGRAGIFRILVRQILEQSPKLQATVIASSRQAFRVPRNLYRRVQVEVITSPQETTRILPALVKHRPGLLVIDELSPENVHAAFEATQSGQRVLAQVDTVFRGTELPRVLLEWGLAPGQLDVLAWVVAVQRIPTLCECKKPLEATSEQVDAIQRRYPHLQLETGERYYAASQCAACQHSGRQGEVTAFDIYQGATGADQARLFPLETYLLGLAKLGQVPLSDLLRLELDQLHRTYQLFTASEQNLQAAQVKLESKLVELEAANRVLRNRTEELVSLQEIGQALIGSTTLRDLARLVCRQASALCGADRVVFYYLGKNESADVLASHGWAPGRVPPRVLAQEVCDRRGNPNASSFNHWPPGVTPRPPEVEGAILKAGLRVPLVAQGQPVGALIVHSTRKARFQPGEIALLQTFANQAALAIQRAGLIEQLQDKIEQLQAAQAGLVQKERLERELELAREVQQAVLPTVFPAIPGYAFAAHNEPARQVGGDFYDVIDLGEGRFGLVVADVSDKGMPAALYMALTRSVIVAEARREHSPAAVLRNVNELLRDLGRARMFVTVFYGVVDGAQGTMTYTRAGHERGLLLRAGQVHELPGDGVFLGFLGAEDLFLSEETLALQAGDRLVLFTDGLADVVSKQGHSLERAGLYQLLAQHAGLSAAELVNSTFLALDEYQAGAEQFDDMTLLVTEVFITSKT